MKKILRTLCLTGALALVSSCNYQVVDLKWKFTKAYCKWPDGSMKVLEIRKWKDFENSDQIQIIDNAGNVYLFHSVNVVLADEF